MRDTIHTLRNFAIYLLPASLLATAGALLITLLYYPLSHDAPMAKSRIIAGMDDPHGQADAATLFSAMLADALRQIQVEPEAQARTLMYRYENGVPMEERPVMLRSTPPMIRHGDGSDHPVLIRL